MRLAVISDTHLREPSGWFKRFFTAHLLGADALIHCGDITGQPMLDYMADNHPMFYGVSGNMCDQSVVQELPALLRVQLAGRSLGVTHGWGEKARLPQAVFEAFGPGLDLILFGHSHRQAKMTIGDTLLVNPGSLSGETPCMAFVNMVTTGITVEFRSFSAIA